MILGGLIARFCTPYRAYIIVAVAVALTSGGAFVGYRVRDAQAQRDVVKQLHGALQAKDEAIQARDRAIIDRDRATNVDTRVARALDTLRTALEAHARELQAELRARPVTRRVEHEENGKTVVCVERDPALYWLYFNRAVAGPSASPTPSTAPTDAVPAAVPR